MAIQVITAEHSKPDDTPSTPLDNESDKELTIAATQSPIDPYSHAKFQANADVDVEVQQSRNTTDDEQGTGRRRGSRSSRSSRSSMGDDDDRIHGWRDVVAALKLTWTRQQKHLLITWIHVPLGVAFLLVVSWGLRLAIEQAPFRFPAPVIAMLIFFFGLLLLEWLSIRFPGQENEASSAEEGLPQRDAPKRKQRRFVDPVMRLFAPPCEWCLRNMSVMFTPSFILIPARETIPGKEIGLLAAWFTASQIIAFVLPVWFNLAIERAFKEYTERFGKQAKERARRLSAASVENSRRGSMATLSGVEYEKGVAFNGGSKLGAVATGLSGLTAHVIAPVTHVRVELDDDVRRQIESTVYEYARQQGDPAAIGHHPRLEYRPVSDVSTFHHPHGLLHRSHSHGRSDSRRRRSSRSRDRQAAGHRSYDSTHKSSIRPRSAGDKRQPTSPLASQTPHTSTDTEQRRPSRSTEIHALNHVLPAPTHSTEVRASNHVLPAPTYRFPAKPSTGEVGQFQIPRFDVGSGSGSGGGDSSGLQTAVASRRPSTIDPIAVDEKRKIEFAIQDHPGRRDDAANNVNASTTPSISEEEEEDEPESAVERLASWFADLITPLAYFILFIVGIPIFFVLNIALPLFMAINILTFLASITIVPPKIRRFAHPILTTSVATVLIIWAFAAMKGIGLKNCLNDFYSVDARYNVLWNPSGYNGPIPGAGDILFSTLDAGIVALAVPMYRYRKELWDNLTRMMIVLIPCAALSLFAWNSIAHAMGLDGIRALAFSARFMSTPLAIELASNIGADESITVILVVITGVVAAIFKEQFFYRLMRVSKDDYLTVGLTMGATSGAIGASSLLSTPRTMAIASLAFVLFGTILLVATAIPPIVEIVQQLSGL